jgi:hypothetical protein
MTFDRRHTGNRSNIRRMIMVRGSLGCISLLGAFAECNSVGRPEVAIEVSWRRAISMLVYTVKMTHQAAPLTEAVL